MFEMLPPNRNGVWHTYSVQQNSWAQKKSCKNLLCLIFKKGVSVSVSCPVFADNLACPVNLGVEHSGKQFWAFHKVCSFFPHSKHWNKLLHKKSIKQAGKRGKQTYVRATNFSFPWCLSINLGLDEALNCVSSSFSLSNFVSFDWA